MTTPPLSRFSDLDPATQVFLENLRSDEVGLLAEAINFMRSVKTVGRFVKWSIVLAVGSFIGMVALGEAVGKFKNYLLGK